jgi:hypothetical protein
MKFMEHWGGEIFEAKQPLFQKFIATHTYRRAACNETKVSYIVQYYFHRVRRVAQ